MAYNNDLIIENAKIMYCNFSGVKSDFNPDGKREFCVVIEDIDLAQKLVEEGWNVKVRKPRDEGDLPTHYIPVEVRFDKFPPKVVMITDTAKRLLDENLVGDLDGTEFECVDLIINPSRWEMAGRSGIKAYLKSGYFVIKEDKLSAKYAI